MTTAQVGPPTCEDHQRSRAMEFTGFVVFSASSSFSLNNAITEVKQSLNSNPRIESGPLLYGRGNLGACERFLRCGAEDTFSERIKEAIGNVGILSPPRPLRQGPVVVLSRESYSWGSGLAHPSHDGVSAFRDLSNDGDTRVSFKLYPSSQDLSKEELAALGTQPVVRKLMPNDILFVKGSVRIEIEMPAGGSFVWQGNRGEPMGLDMLGPEVFPFMRI